MARTPWGPSTSGLFRRSLTALRTPDRIRARIALSYRNAAQFQQAYGDLLPKEAQKVLADFAQIPQMRKMARVRALRKGGFRMQSKAAPGGDDVVWVMRCLFRVLFTTFPCAHREIGVK